MRADSKWSYLWINIPGDWECSWHPVISAGHGEFSKAERVPHHRLLAFTAIPCGNMENIFCIWETAAVLLHPVSHYTNSHLWDNIPDYFFGATAHQREDSLVSLSNRWINDGIIWVWVYGSVKTACQGTQEKDISHHTKWLCLKLRRIETTHREKELTNASPAQEETVDVGFHRQPRAIWWRVLKAAKTNENLKLCSANHIAKVGTGRYCLSLLMKKLKFNKINQMTPLRWNNEV